MTADLDRFMATVMPIPECGCWVWVGARHTAGYGVVWKDYWRMRAHRWSYEHLVGPIPEGLVIDHKCRVRSCVNPDHLRVVSHKENILCGIGHTAKNAAKTHCINGHELSGNNVLFFPSRPERRCCKKCLRARNIVYKRKQAASHARAMAEEGGLEDG